MVNGIPAITMDAMYPRDSQVDQISEFLREENIPAMLGIYRQYLKRGQDLKYFSVNPNFQEEFGGFMSDACCFWQMSTFSGATEPNIYGNVNTYLISSSRVQIKMLRESEVWEFGFEIFEDERGIVFFG